MDAADAEPPTADGGIEHGTLDSESLSHTRGETPAADLDAVLEELGDFGRYHVTSYALISLPIVFTVVTGSSYVFTAGDVPHRCRIPECEGNSTEFLPWWLPHAVPWGAGEGEGPSRCLRYAPAPTNGSEPACGPHAFLQSTHPCSEWVFEPGESTIASEWDITCDHNQWKLSMVGTVNSMGYMVTTPIAGYVSDRCGRKTVLLSAVLLACVCGLARSCARSYEAFLAWEFLDMAVGGSVFETAFVLGMELVSPRRRVLGAAIVSAYNGVGGVVLGVLGWCIPHWRALLRAVYGPGILLGGYYWLLPESVRWLLSQGRVEEAEAIIRRAAATNGVRLSGAAQGRLLGAAQRSPSTDAAPLRTALGQVLRSRVLLLRLFVCCWCSSVSMFVFYGLSLNAVSHSVSQATVGHKHASFALVSFVELPAYLVCALAMAKAGRRPTLCVSLAASGLCCVGYMLVGGGLRSLLFLGGKFCITMATTVLYVFPTEMFPTQMRHCMLGTCSLWGGVGVTMAPMTPLLARSMESLPLLLFAVMSLGSSLMSLLLPETVGTRLPETIEEAEAIGRGKGGVSPRDTC